MDLDQGETLSWERRANHAVGMRAIGGKLHLTSRRLVFEPHGFDKATGGADWQRSLDNVTGAGAAPRQLTGLFNGGLRKRLQIDLRDGSSELFVIGDLDEVVEEISRAAG